LLVLLTYVYHDAQLKKRKVWQILVDASRDFSLGTHIKSQIPGRDNASLKLAYFINCDKVNHFWITPATGWLLELFDVNTVFTVVVVLYRLLVLVNVT